MTFVDKLRARPWQGKLLAGVAEVVRVRGLAVLHVRQRLQRLLGPKQALLTLPCMAYLLLLILLLCLIFIL